MEDILIPLAAMVSVFGTITLVSYWILSYRYRTRSELLKTLREAAEQGQALTPEIIQSIAENFRGHRSDLRRGVISLSLGIAGLLCSLVVSDEDVMVFLRVLSMFPTFLGIGYLGLSYFLKRERSDALAESRRVV